MRCSKSACPFFFLEVMGFLERFWRCLGGGGGGGCGGIRCGVGQTCVRPTGLEDCYSAVENASGATRTFWD